MRQLTATLILTILLLAQAVDAGAQKKQAAPRDTVDVPLFNGIDIHFEAVGAIQKIASDHGQWEGGVRINLKDKYFPAFEIGIGKADEEEKYNEQMWCKVKAPYFRVGCDFNILRNKHDDYRAFAGLRYAYSHFDYDLTTAETTSTTTTTTLDDGTTEETTVTATTYTTHRSLNATYHWLEAVFGVDAKIWGPLHLGWDVRYRRALTNKHSDEGEPWYIPGFGNKKNAGFTALFWLGLSF